MRKILLTLAGAVLLTGCGAKTEEKKAEGGDSTAPKTVASAPIDPATAGSIAGKVDFTGEKPAARNISMDAVPACAKQHQGAIPAEDVIVNKNGTLKNVFVYVKDGLPGNDWAVPAKSVELDQKGCLYTPHVLALQVGQDLEISNSDPTNHNIHPIPKSNKEWNESQPPQGDKKIKQFSKPETMIAFKCNVHPWMRAYVNVSPHPFYALTGEDGTFELKGLPPGEYTVEAVHERFGTKEMKVTVAPKQSAAAEFQFKAE